MWFLDGGCKVDSTVEVYVVSDSGTTGEWRKIS